MSDATAKYVASNTRGQSPGMVRNSEGRWYFSYDTNQTPLVSSRRKLVYLGTFVGNAHAAPVAARALAFEPRCMAAFGSECANLGQLDNLGVGPRLLAITQYDFTMSGISRPVIIEEDAGESLASLLGDTSRAPQGLPILHGKGTHERELENQKVLFDVFVQLLNAHQAGIYHRDLRCENVCVRRFGERPADIRATIIDFELGGSLTEGGPRTQASLYDTLFSLIPSHLAGKPLTVSPNPLELDMAYLAALQYHLYCDRLVLNGDEHTDEELAHFVAYLAQNVSYFRYHNPDSPLQARHLDRTLDIDQLANQLELVPVNEASFESQQLLAHAQSFHKPYLDGEDMKDCMSGPEARLAEMIDRLVEAKFETYKALRRQQGLDVPYERHEDQPLDLQRSNYAQAEHIPVKVHALGYLLVMEDSDLPYEEVTSFSDEQIEALARLEHDRWIDERLTAGWMLDRDAKRGDPVAKTSPYLVPYDELADDIKEYDRDAARQLIPLVKSAGLKVVRPK